MKPLQVVIMGHGYLGKWHAQKVALCKEAELYAIVEPNELGQESARLAHPKCKVVANLSEVVEFADALFIVTPTSTHYDVLKEILPYKKHIFCEKPICATEAEAIEIIELISKQPEQKIQVGHSERFHPLVSILKDLIQQNQGRPYSLEFIRVTSPKGRALDVHVTDDIMIHDIDLLLHVLGKNVLSMFPIGFQMHSKNLDFVDVTLLLEDGGKARMKSCREEVEEMRIIHFYTQSGHYKFDLMNYVWSSMTSKEGLKEFRVEKKDHLLEEHRAFYDAILAKKEVVVSAQEALQNITFLKKIHQILGVI